MGQNQDSQLNKQFLKHLRVALNHLYDPDQLRQGPLAVFFHVEGHFDTPSAIQRILTHAIESFKSPSNSPAHIHNQQVYELLLYRYIQHINQDELAHQLGVSVRQFRREQNQAIYELGCRLWQEFAGGATPLHEELLPESESDESELSTDNVTAEEQSSELTWLKNMSPEKTTDISKTMGVVMDLIAPLALQKEVTIQHTPVGPYLLAMHPVALQQILLGLLSDAIDKSPGNTIEITFTPTEQTLEISISYPLSRKSSAQPAQAGDPAPVIITNILELSGGTLAYGVTSKQGSFRVTFPMVKPRIVLVIEDNEEIVSLMQRYVLNMNYTISVIKNPARFLQEIVETRPSLIILDIMMPQIDGLEALSQIKHHPELCRIPVIVCSVLPQQKLALASGAADYLQKPIRRDMFIAALERQSIS
jgi:CheY-like chemotaxis protein